jgi:hypothetical protein
MKPYLKENIMETPADTAICKLIETLADRAAKWSTSDDERAEYIKQIARLRASMNPQIIQTKD